ncbi:MAG: hypothetical protein IPK97_06615 [Ahniella sp.]|nr:hypothetical protein [Ahniella sp.]
MPVRYFLTAPTAQNPTGPLTGVLARRPGAYVPPFNAAGLDATSTNVTFANPFPVATVDAGDPVLATVPNAASGRTKPAAGWPVVIFQHGITRNRSDALAISGTMAAQGFAVIAIDQPLHGIRAIDPGISGFYIENTPFGADRLGAYVRSRREQQHDRSPGSGRHRRQLGYVLHQPVQPAQLA